MKNFGLSIKNATSLIIHTIIVLAGAVVLVLPELQVLLIENYNVNPNVASIIIILVGTVLKKLLDEK